MNEVVPYKVEKEGSVYYIKVLTYNRQVWYPWSYIYLTGEDYPSSQKRYGKKFKTQTEAEDF